MKRILCFCCGLLLLAGLQAQTKVLEKSAKKAPEWLNTAVDDYLVVTVIAPSLAEAQQRAINEVTERIILSVASNVTVSTRNEMSEVNINGVIDSKDDFSRLSRMRSANLPFLKGISSTKVEEVYWQKMQDKSSKKMYYEYSVKYPYPDAEQRSLEAQFEALDAEKSAQYEALEQRIHALESVEEIKRSITQLNMLLEYFFDEVRIGQVKGLKERYEQLYEGLSLVGRFDGEGRYLCQVLLEGNPIRTGATPKVTSNCAGQLAVTPQDGAFLITYDAIDCLPEEENFLHIAFKFARKRVELKAYLSEAGGASASAATFSVVPEGKLILTAAQVDASTRQLTDLTLRLTLNNRGGTAFGLKSIELQVPEISAPIVFDDIDGVYKTKGIIQIKAQALGQFTAREKKQSALSFVQGAVTLVNPETGAIERQRISLPYVTNWE